MTETAGAVQNGLVLRMSVPAAGELAGLGAELAMKLAEQLGVSEAGAGKVGDAIDELTRAIGPVAGREVAFEFHKQGEELRIEARHGDQVRTTTVFLSA